MQTTTVAASSRTDIAIAAPWRDYWLLVRFRIIGLVLFTMTIAALAAGPQIPAWTTLVHSLVGSALVIAGAIALNQRIERRTDALMVRTARRPLPSGRMTTLQATSFGLAASVAGLGYLVATTPWHVVALTLGSWILYVWIYTPMKLFSAWQTPMGALAGALPTLMGAAVAEAPMSLMAMTLFGIVYFWQFPHAMAIAWMYRRDFASADIKVATVVDPTGRTAGVLSVVGAVALLAVTLAPWFAGLTGWGYAAAAILFGSFYLVSSVRFLRRIDDPAARNLLYASLLYLPAVFVALLIAAI